MRADSTMVDFLQRALGYCLAGSTEEQVLFIAHGPGGTGKSVTLNVVRDILGSYAQAADRNLLIKTDANRIQHNLAQLRGARFATAIETGRGNEMDEVTVKQVTGCDAVTARVLYGNNFTFTPSAKVWLATNHLPAIKSQDTGIWRRIRQVPFDHVIEAPFREKDYDKQLAAEEGPGILRWLVQGYRKWRESGLTEPPAVVHAVAEYRDQGDEHKLAEFVRATCETNANARCSLADLYTAYAVWHRTQDDDELPSLSKPAFSERLAEMGFRRSRWHHGQTRGFVGLDVGKAEVH